MSCKDWIIRKIGGVPKPVYENMKRSRNHWKSMYCKHNRKLKAVPVDIDFTYKRKQE